AALTWTVQLVVGFGVTVARCGPANAVLGVDVKAWELTLMGTGIALALLAEAAALNILWQTRNVDYGGPPPEGRRHFFALAASIAAGSLRPLIRGECWTSKGSVRRSRASARERPTST